MFEGNITVSLEGAVRWVRYEELLNLKLADGFVDMLPVFEGKAKELIYRNGGKEWIE